MRGHARLLALMRWDRERRLLWPWGGVVGEGYAPDPRLGGEVLRRFPPSRGWLLADAGFDGKEVWGVLGEAGVRPVIRLRGAHELRLKAHRPPPKKGGGQGLRSFPSFPASLFLASLPLSGLAGPV